MQTKSDTQPDAFARAVAQVPSCALDAEGLARQRERHRRLSPSVVKMAREGDVLTVEFAPGFDRGALEELLAVERECCPFFTFAFDERSRRLEAGVHNPEFAQALDLIGQQLGATEGAQP